MYREGCGVFVMMSLLLSMLCVSYFQSAVFPFKSCAIADAFAQNIFICGKAIVCRTCNAFVDTSQAHVAMDRGCKRLSIFMQQLRSQRIFSLCNRDAVLLQMGNFCAKISCQAIFMSMQYNTGDDAGKTCSAQRNIRG